MRWNLRGSQDQVLACFVPEKKGSYGDCPGMLVEPARGLQGVGGGCWWLRGVHNEMERAGFGEHLHETGEKPASCERISNLASIPQQLACSKKRASFLKPELEKPPCGAHRHAGSR